MPRKKAPKERKQKEKYKIYRGVRCVLIIIPTKIKEDAGIDAGDYVSFEYDTENDKIIVTPDRG